jgi:hypothetical protein
MPPGDIVVSVPGSFRGWSPGGFSVVLPSWPHSLVAILPLMVGSNMEGLYAAPCNGLWIIANRRQNIVY